MFCLCLLKSSASKHIVHYIFHSIPSINLFQFLVHFDCTGCIVLVDLWASSNILLLKSSTSGTHNRCLTRSTPSKSIEKLALYPIFTSSIVLLLSTREEWAWTWAKNESVLEISSQTPLSWNLYNSYIIDLYNTTTWAKLSIYFWLKAFATTLNFSVC